MEKRIDDILAAAAAAEPADMDWGSLTFGYYPTDYNVRCEYKDGKWGDIEVSDSVTLPIHMAATCLHYGQEAFEGLKAFRGKDGKTRVFRMEKNAERFRSSAEGIKMEPLPLEKFCEMVRLVVRLNKRFVPPYGSGASLYIRPLEIGTTAAVGVKPASEYMVVMFVSPVGPYFKTGFKPSKICISRNYDRVAPKGTGRFKIGGNYAASLASGELAHAKGYSAMLYIDPKDKLYLDECGPANFFGILDGKYVTPKSDSILPSITNLSLRMRTSEISIRLASDDSILKRHRPTTSAASDFLPQRIALIRHLLCLTALTKNLLSLHELFLRYNPRMLTLDNNLFILWYCYGMLPSNADTFTPMPHNSSIIHFLF